MVELASSQSQRSLVREFLFNAWTVFLLGSSFVLLDHFLLPEKSSTNGTYTFAFVAFVLLLSNYSHVPNSGRGFKKQLLMGAFIASSAWLINLVMYGLANIMGFSYSENFQLKQSIFLLLGIYVVVTSLCLTYNWICTTSFGVAVKHKWNYISELKWLNNLLALIVLGSGLFIAIYAYALTH